MPSNPLVYALLSTVTAVAAEHMHATDIGAPQVSTLTVLLYDYAWLPDGATRKLEQRTGEIMSGVGIPLDWVHCRGPKVSSPHEPCSAKTQPGRVVLRIVAHCPEGGAQSGDVLGSAVTPGNYVCLCAAQIFKIENDNWLDRGSVMPYAAAHEIGHLLLGPDHSASGIMRAVWGKAELSAMERLVLYFSAGEAEVMRRAVTAALTPAAAILPATGRTPSPPAGSNGHSSATSRR